MPFKRKDNSLIKDKVSNRRRRIEIELGDTKTPDAFLPQFKTKHWDNEANFSMRYAAESFEGGEMRQNGEAVEWHGDGVIARMYDRDTGDEDGGFEFEIEFSEAPKSNSVKFSIQTKSLVFIKQYGLDKYITPQPGEVLTETHYYKKDGTLFAHRPERIVNSYAVYHADRKHNFKDKEYATGKAFHIYRPHITDAAGNEAWGDIEINEKAGELTVTVPKHFLKDAIYPVIVDPTVGYTTQGGTVRTLCSSSEDLSVAWKAFGLSGATVTAISAYIYSGAATTDSFRYRILGTTSGLPNGSDTRYASSFTTMPTTMQLRTISGLSTVLGNSDWIVADGSANSGSASGNIAMDTGGIDGMSASTNGIGVWALSGGARWSLYATYTAAADIEQEGFRFRADDGSETSATWKAAQDTNVTAPRNTNTRLRMLLTSPNDPPSRQYLLQYKKTSDSIWKKVGAVVSGVFPTWLPTASLPAGTTSLSMFYPESLARGDLLVLHVGNKYPNNGPSTPSGWTAITNNQASGGSGSSGIDSGNVYSTVFLKIADGTESGSFTITISSGNASIAYMSSLRAPDGKEFDLSLCAAAIGSYSGNSTAWSATAGSNPGITSGDLLMALSAAHRDDRAYSAQSMSATGATFTTHTERYERGTSQGDDLEIIGSTHTVTAGTASAAPVFTMTVGTGASGATVFLRIRMRDQAITLAASSNIAASGAATTAQLTPPSGKTTSNFTAGRIQDDENPADAVDIASNGYTELEWCLTATNQSADAEVYEFRVVHDAFQPLDTYTVTPQWTLGTPANTDWTQDCSASVTLGDSAIRGPSRILVDTTTLSDVITRGSSRVIAEAITLVDSFSRLITFSRTFTDTSALADSIERQESRTLSETTTLVDTLVRSSSRAFSEAIALVDTVLRTAARSLTEVVVAVDTIVRQSGKTLSESAALVATMLRSGTRTLSEAVTLVATFISAATMYRTFSETVALSASLLNQAGKTLVEAVALSATFLRSMTRTFSEVATLTDTALRSISRSYSEAIALSDTLLRQAGKTLTEAITAVSSVLSQASLYRTYSETVSLAATFTSQASRTLSESIALADTMLRQAGKVIANTVTLADTVIRSSARSLVEALALSDVFSSIKTQFRTYTESVPLADTIVRAPGRMLAEAVTLVDTVVRQASRTLSDAVALADSVVKSSSRTLTDAANLADSILRGSSRTLSETVTLVASLVKMAGKVLNDAATLADTIVRQPGKVLSEALALSDSFIRSASRSLVEAVTLVDSTLRSFTRALLETVVLTDTSTRFKGTLKNLSESIVLTDVFSSSSTFYRTLSDTVALVDRIVRSQARTLSDTVTLVASVIKRPGKVLSEVAAMRDVLTRSIARTITNTISIAAVFSRAFTRQFSEAVSLADSYVRSMSRRFSESVTIDAVFFRGFQVTYEEALALADRVERGAQLVLTEAISLVDTLAEYFRSAMRVGRVVLTTLGDKAATVLRSKADDQITLSSKEGKTVLGSKDE